MSHTKEKSVTSTQHREEKAQAQPSVGQEAQPFFSFANQVATPAPSFFAPVQTKLSVNEPGDEFEQEADEVAEKVMRMEAGPVQRTRARSDGGEQVQRFSLSESIVQRSTGIQRKCAQCEAEGESLIQRSGGGQTAVPASVDAGIKSSRGNGQPLDGQTATFMESRFGTSFGNVRIHNDSNAAGLNSQLQARAFAVGSDIYFNRSEYQPQSSSGKQLLAHELTHVVQQRNGMKRIARAPFVVGTPPNQVSVSTNYKDVAKYKAAKFKQGALDTFKRCTGETAAKANLDAVIAALSADKQQWLMYALDLLIDNKLAGYDKNEGAKKLVAYASMAQFTPGAANNDFENEALRFSGWFDVALAANLTAPTGADLTKLEGHFAGAAVAAAGAPGSSTCPSPRAAGDALDKAKLKKELPALTEAVLYKELQKRSNGGAAMKQHSSTEIINISDVIEEEAMNFFSPYISRGSSRLFLNTWEYSKNLQIAGAAVPLQWRLDFISNRATKQAELSKLFERSHFDWRCIDDQTEFVNLVADMEKDATIKGYADKIAALMSFTGQDSTSATVTLSTKFPSAKNECEDRWATINVMCHELMHVFVHQDFYTLHKSRQLIREGFTEILGDQLYNQIVKRSKADATFRAKFEGGIKPSECAAATIPASTTDYGVAGKAALDILNTVKDDNFRAAYFLGRINLVGLKPKLTVGQPDDEYEKEADAVAEQVMRMPEDDFTPVIGAGEEQVQRCAECEAEEGPVQMNKVQRKCAKCEAADEPVQMKQSAVEPATREHVQLCAECEAEEEIQPKRVAAPMIQLKCATCEAAEEKVQLMPSIQLKPGDDKKKYKIDYDAAFDANLKSWYAGYKFYNLFHEEKIYPGMENGVEYANHVYELQLNIISWKKDDYNGLEANGILDGDYRSSLTILAIKDASILHAGNNTQTFGIDPKKLERIYGIAMAHEPKPSPLISPLRNYPVLDDVNHNSRMYIQFDDQGDYVTGIQYALSALKYDLGSDVKEVDPILPKVGTGKYGEGTREAVRSFQKDNGAEGKEADGILGQTTLRVLDMKLFIYNQQHQVNAGSAMVFRIPVTEADAVDKTDAKYDTIRKDILIKVLLAAFPITTEQAQDYIGKNTWFWTEYPGVKPEHVKIGYLEVKMFVTDYEALAGNLEALSPGSSERREQLDADAIDLSVTGTLYSLSKRVAELESAIDSMQNAPREMKERRPTAEIAAKRAELAQVVKQRDEELKRLGLTSDIYSQKKESFIKGFKALALGKAFEMLSRNEKQANIELNHYSSNDGVTDLQGALKELQLIYDKSDAALMKGIGFQESGEAGENKYASENDYMEAKKKPGADDEYAYPRERLAHLRVDELKKRNEKNPHYARYYDAETEATKLLMQKAERFPLLAYPGLGIRKNAKAYAGMAPESLGKILKDQIKPADGEGIIGSIANTRAQLRDKPDTVWEMPPVIMNAKAELGVLEGTVLDSYVMDAMKAHQSSGFYRKMGFAAVALGVGLLALLSGPVGWAALAASIVLGAYDAYDTYKDISQKRDAYNTSMNPALALGTENPDYFWFVVSLVALGLDLGAAVSVVRKIGEGAKMANDVVKALEAEKEIIKNSAKTTAREVEEAGRRIARIDEALSRVNKGEYIQHVELLRPLRSNPHAMRVMNEAMRDKQVLEAFTTLSKYVGKNISEDVFKSIMTFYAGMGRKSIGELPELVRLIETGPLKTNAKALEAVMTDFRVQKVLLDSHQPEMVVKEFDLWEKALKEGKALSFADHLKALGFETKAKRAVPLVEQFGQGFNALSATAKNRQVLRSVEPRLLDAFDANALSPVLQQKMGELLAKDLLGLTNDVGRAQQRVLRELETLGKSIEMQSDYVRVMSLLNDPFSKRIVANSAVNLLGRDKYLALLEKIKLEKNIPADVYDDLLKIGPMTDEGTIIKLIDDKVIRKTLLDNPTAILVLKKCASPCFPPSLTPEQIKRLSAALDGKTPDELRKANEFIYKHRNDPKALDGAIDDLVNRFTATINGVNIPALVVPDKFKAVSGIKNNLKLINDMGVPVAQLNNIMNTFVLHGAANAEDFIYTLRALLELERNLPSKHINVILKGLESTDKTIMRTAEHLMDEAVRFKILREGDAGRFTYPGFEKANALLDTYSLADLSKLRDARWVDAFVLNLFDVTTGIKATKEEIADLIAKAGKGGKGDLDRLWRIRQGMPAQPLPDYKEMVEAIKASDAFAESVKLAMADGEKGFETLAKQMWGADAQVTGDTIEVAANMRKGTKDSGKAVFNKVTRGEKDVATAMANAVVDSSGINFARWEVLKKVVMNANINGSIKNNLIGELWTRVHLKYYENLGYQVFREIEMIPAAGGDLMRADIWAVKGKELLIIECKALEGEVSAAQDVVYKLMEANKFDAVKVVNPEMEKLYLAYTKQYLMRAEAKLVPKQ
ncbi:DUF4157 domain-containing protein [uncultured Chitinophaga sp.]|uniref:eCIS core domain-containing protein n=1 Tax=uncultured Chitinophaga sp. TaxID=339340 RepID=UPI0025CF165E|nr:DUF4157 domain-containing protein [uncultured Chitinophaga sp.]